LSSTFPDNTYAVLDVPSPVAERVLAVREQQRDWFRFSLPAEITIVGSGGLGVFATDQEPDDVYHALSGIARTSAPIRASFGPVRRFASSDVYYLSLADARPFRELQGRIASAGLRFQPVPFPFVPHCTLRTRAPVAEHEAAALLRIRIEEEFVLDTLSLYELRGAAIDAFTVLCLHHRSRLSG
jgi:2'-5' RNA ligase